MVMTILDPVSGEESATRTVMKKEMAGSSYEPAAPFLPVGMKGVPCSFEYPAVLLPERRQRSAAAAFSFSEGTCGSGFAFLRMREADSFFAKTGGYRRRG